MSWIDKTENETAAAFLARVSSSWHDCVSVSRQSGATIAYSANGLILRQRETVVTKEVRGITEAAAILLEDLKSDATASVVHYKPIGDNGEYAVVSVTIGTKTDVSSALANDAGAWTATITETTCTAADSEGWTTTRPSTASSSGIVTNIQRNATRLAVTSALAGAISSTGSYGTTGTIAALYQNVETTTRQYLFLTQAEARALVASLNSQVSGAIAVASFAITGQTLHYRAKNYTVKRAAASYISAERGWTVTCDEYAYSPAAFYSAPEGSEAETTYFTIGETSLTAAPYVHVSAVWYDGPTWNLVEE